MSANILQFVPVSDAPNRIRELRIAAGLSQQALGDAINVSKVTISDLERGNMGLNLDYMERIAIALGVTAPELLPRRLNPYDLTPDARDLVDRYNAATPEQKDQLQRMADVIVPYRSQDAA